jgi:transposase
VRLWIELFNRGGIDVLITKPRPGRKRKVKLQRVRDLLVPVLENPAQAGQGHGTGVKLHGYLKEQLQIELGYSTIARRLHELNFHLWAPQPWPERQNDEERKAFLEELRGRCADPKWNYGSATKAVWKVIRPRPRRRWVQPGRRRTVPYLRDHLHQNVIGAVAPASGGLICRIVDGVDTDVFQFFLEELAKAVLPRPGVRQMLVLDASLAQSRAAELAPLRAEVPAGLLAGLPSHRATVVATQSRLVLGPHR